MRITTIFVLLAATAVGVSGLAPQRQVLVTYPKDTPESAIDSAKDSIRAAVSTIRNIGRSSLTQALKGGQITAEFSESRPTHTVSYPLANILVIDLIKYYPPIRGSSNIQH